LSSTTRSTMRRASSTSTRTFTPLEKRTSPQVLHRVTKYPTIPSGCHHNRIGS
jgi:hypothetical protein